VFDEGQAACLKLFNQILDDLDKPNNLVLKRDTSLNYQLRKDQIYISKFSTERFKNVYHC
jgi:hypothetical protein